MADDFDITSCIGGVDENEMISKMEPHSNFVHLSQEPLAVTQKAFQPYVWGWNSGGRPMGLWITPSSEWLVFRQQANMSVCCYLYDIKVNMSKMLVINNKKDFKQFDKKYRNYWLNLDYQRITDFKWYPNGEVINVDGDLNKLNEIWNNMTWLDDKETTYEALIRLKLIFDSPEAAKEGCEAYRKHPEWIKIFKYKDWNHVSSEYSGIVINNWAKNKEGLKYLWYQSLNITSGCIWDPQGIIDIIPTMIKKTPTIWMGAADGTVRRMSNFSGTSNNTITGGTERKITAVANTTTTTADTAARDETIASLIPNKISECAIHLGKKPGDTCASNTMLAKLSTVVGQGNPEEIIARAKQITKTSTERDAIIALQGKLGHEFVAAETISVHKIAGPTSAALLSNTNIDTLLKQWTIAFPDFFAYNFNMLDYARNSFRDGAVIPSPDTLATISVADLYRIGHFRRAACVINSDVYTGEGKHWMVLYVDMSGGSGSGGSEDSATVEFFNSSGNAPAPEWINWLEKSRAQLEDIGIKCEIIRVSTLRHQDSKSECGVYSLFYIWARLHGVPYSYFSKKIPDKIMFEFRQHIFTDPRRPALKEFNWDEYKRGTKIAWE